MNAIATIEAIATLLWCFAGLSFVAWARHLRRAPQQSRVGHVVELIANMVPAMVCLLVVVIVGAVLGFPTVVVLIAVLFPAGLAFAAHMSLNEIHPDRSYRAEAVRLGVALALGAAVIYFRQIR